MIVVYIIITSFVIVFIYSFIKELNNKKYDRDITVNGKKYTFNVRNINNDKLNKWEQEAKKEMEEAREINRAWERLHFPLFELQSNGMEYEKKQEIDNAVSSYTQVIQYINKNPQIAVNHYYHSIERLSILYRKLKRYDDEIFTIEFALSKDLRDKDRDYMNNRLIKAKQLRDKSMVK